MQVRSECLDLCAAIDKTKTARSANVLLYMRIVVQNKIQAMSTSTALVYTPGLYTNTQSGSWWSVHNLLAYGWRPLTATPISNASDLILIYVVHNIESTTLKI